RCAADFLVEPPAGTESLSVVIPWSSTNYQYTSKHLGLPARGVVTVGDTRYDCAAGLAVLDHGRGRWPKESAWIWACGVGKERGGRVVGWNLGGRWTDGTGLSENGLFIGGRVEKLDEELEFDFDRDDWRRPWRIRAPSGRLELVF